MSAINIVSEDEVHVEVKVISASGHVRPVPPFVVHVRRDVLSEDLRRTISDVVSDLPAFRMVHNGRMLRDGARAFSACTPSPADALTTVYVICKPPAPPPTFVSSFALSSPVGVKVDQINKIVRGMIVGIPPSPSDQVSLLGQAYIPQVIEQVRALLSDPSQILPKSSLSSQLRETAHLIDLLKDRLLSLTTLLSSGPSSLESARREAANIASVLQHIALLFTLVATALNNSNDTHPQNNASEPNVEEEAQASPSKKPRTAKQNS
ncbi:hypothetical protein Pelo_4093 [Pelomyxa schiedti]|nr:hypothetical protein Pelo_4093 [Pelomyxa schiedti]